MNGTKITATKAGMALTGATPYDRQKILDLPQGSFEIVIKEQDRSGQQNKLSHAWYKEVASQLEGYTQEQVRAMSKLHCGVPIRRRDDDDWRAAYDDVIKPLSYERKLNFIEKADYEVTRNFGVRQMTEYLEAMQQFWADAGVVLLFPDELAELRGKAA